MMNKEQKKIAILVIGLILMLLIIFSQEIFYEHYMIPKQLEALEDVYAENFMGVNRAWIDIYEGKKNLSENDIESIEVMLDGIEERLKNG